MSVSPHDGVTSTYVQPAIYRRSVAPTTGSIGDLWVDTSTNPAKLKECTAEPPSIAWTEISGGGGGYAVLGANTFTALQTITQASANAGILASTGYSLTGSDATPMVSLAGTINTSATTLDVFKIAVTMTGAGAGSNLFAVYGGASGTSKWLSVGKAGDVAVQFFRLFSGATQIGDWGYQNNGITCPFTDGIGWCATAAVGGTRDAQFVRGGAAGAIQQGLADAASPVAQTLKAQGSRAGTDSNVAGASYTHQSGTGTGTGTPSTLILKSPIAVASGTGAQTQTTGLVINVGTAVLTSYTVANLPAAATAGVGATAFVTDASTTLILGLGGVVTGGGTNKVPVYSDGTNWVYG